MSKFFYRYRSGGGASIIGMLILFFMIYLLFRVVGVVYSILWGLIPIMLILSLIINRSTIVDHISSIVNAYKRSIMSGIGYTALNLIGLPFVSVYLLWKSIATRSESKKKRKTERKINEQYVDYEDVEDGTVEEDILELPPLEKSYRREDN